MHKTLLVALREFFAADGATLGTEAEAVILHFEEGDGLRLSSKGFVENENGGFHAGIGLKHARRK